MTDLKQETERQDDPAFVIQHAIDVANAYATGPDDLKIVTLRMDEAKALQAKVEELERDARRLDCLERLANERGGILLHDGSESGRAGLGLRPGCLVRSLREAIDAAMLPQPPEKGRG